MRPVVGERTFAAELTRLLAERTAAAGGDCRWTTTRLAAAVGVDPSLVRRWRRGDRVPALNSSYVARISAALSLSEAESADLKSAQIAALQAHPARRPRGNGVVQQLIAGAQSVQRATPLAPGNRSHDWTATPVARGSGALIDRGIALLQSLPTLENPHSGTVLTTHQGSDNLYHARMGAAEEWRAALAGVLQRGWDLEQLWRLDRDPSRAVHLVERMLALLGGPGEYRPRYFLRPGRLFPPYDVIVVPDRLAMMSFATTQPDHIDASLIVDHPAGVALLRDHFYQLRRETRPFMSVFVRDQRGVFEDTLTEVARKGGDRLMVRNSLSVMTVPREWLRDDSLWVQSRTAPSWGSGAVLAQIRERRRLFQERIVTNRCRDVVPIQAIRHWLVTGRERWARFADSAEHIKPCPAQDRRLWVEHVLETLEQFPRYELALWDEEADGPLPTVFWEVDGEHTVLMVAWRGTPDGQEEMQLAITQPRIVAAFREHFDRLWDGIPIGRREKRSVIELLRRELEMAPSP